MRYPSTMGGDDQRARMRAKEGEVKVIAPILWTEVTRNCHVGQLGDVRVVVVERAQKNRPDGTKHDWHIVVLGDRYTWDKTFCQHDPRDLESTKMAAEARTRLAITSLYGALREMVQRKALHNE